MQFYYFQVADDYLKKPFLSRLFSEKTSVKWVEKKFTHPMKQAGMTVFHCHEIKQNLFHITLIGPGRLNYLNCFYETNQHIFFFEKEEPWLIKMKQCALCQHLTPIDTSSSDYQLLTDQDISLIINH